MDLLRPSTEKAPSWEVCEFSDLLTLTLRTAQLSSSGNQSGRAELQSDRLLAETFLVFTVMLRRFSSTFTV